MLMFNRIYWPCQVLNINEIFLNNIKLVISVNVIHGICHILEVYDLSLNVHKSIVPLLNIENWSNQVLHTVNFSFNFIILMFGVYNNRIVELLDSFKTFHDLIELVHSVYLVNWIVQILQI